MILFYLTSSIVKAVVTERVVARGLGEEAGYKKQCSGMMEVSCHLNGWWLHESQHVLKFFSTVHHTLESVFLNVNILIKLEYKMHNLGRMIL